MVQTIISRPPKVPKELSVLVDSIASGNIYTIKRMLGSASQLALVTANTNVNLVLNGDALKALGALGVGTRQTAVLRETVNSVAVEYPIEVIGKSITTPVVVPVSLVKDKTAPIVNQPDQPADNSGVEESLGTHEMLIEASIPGDIWYQLSACHGANKSLEGLRVFPVSPIYSVLDYNGVQIGPNMGHPGTVPGSRVTLRVVREQITVTFDDVTFTFDATENTNVTLTDGRTLFSAMNEIFADPTRTYGSIINRSGPEKFTNMRFTALNVTPPPLKIDSASIDNDLHPTFNITYSGNKVSYKVTARRTSDGILLIPTNNMVIVDNTVAGTAVIRTGDRLTDSFDGLPVTYYIAEYKDGVATGFVASASLTYNKIPDITVFPSVAMVRNDIAEPISYTSAATIDYSNTNLNSFDVYGTFASGDAAGEYSIGAVDANNRFRIYIGGTGGTSLQADRIDGGNITSISNKTIRALVVGEVLRFRIAITQDGLAHLFAFIGTEQVWASGAVTPFIGGTKFRWQTYASPAASNIKSKDVTDDIKLGIPNLVSLKDLRVRIPVSFCTIPSQQNPTGFESRLLTLDNTVISDWRDALMVSSSGQGQIDIVTANTYTGEKGKLHKVQVRHKAVPDLVASDHIFFPEHMELGQNVGDFTSPSRPVRVYANMMKQCAWGRSNKADYPYIGPGEPGYLDNDGNPITSVPDVLWCFYPLPDERNVDVTYYLEWDGGFLNIQHYLMDSANGWLGAGTITQMTPNKLSWTVRGDRRQARARERAARFLVNSLDTSNPPKNLRLYSQFDDISKTFTDFFISENSKLSGPLRFMDSLVINAPTVMDGVMPWANRPKIYEDIIELARMTNRPVHLNLLPNFAYSDAGLDHLDRMMDMFLTGTGSSRPLGGGVKHIYLEPFNEAWNSYLSAPNGSWWYLAQKAGENGRGPVFDSNNAGAYHANTIVERVWNAQKLYDRIKARYAGQPAISSKLTYGFGFQLEGSDVGLIAAQPGWPTLKQTVEYGYLAPYCPADPNAGVGPGQQPPALDPASIVTWLIEKLYANTIPTIRNTVHSYAKQGMKVGIYEVNVAIPAIKDITDQQIWDLYSSAAFKDFWSKHFLPALATHCGGTVCGYSDTGSVLGYADQMWILLALPNSQYNAPWDAWVEWDAKYRLS